MRLRTLKSRAEFTRVKDGGKWTARSFVLQSKLRDGVETAGEARFGFAVGGRALAVKGEARANAVTRNRARRRLKEAVRLVAPVAALPGYDYVIIGRREALHQSFADLLKDLAQAFEKVHRPPRSRQDRPSSRPDGKRTGGISQTTDQPQTDNNARGGGKS